MSSGGCSLCTNAMPEGEWCRACGFGLPTVDAPEPVEPMDAMRVAIRDANGGPLSTDSAHDRESYRQAKRAAASSEGEGN